MNDCDASTLRVPAWLPPAAALLLFLRQGYGYGVSDHDEMLPQVLHRLDPQLFAHDPFVQSQLGEVTVRTYFLGLLEGLGHLVPLWLAVLLLYAAATMAVAGAVYRLGALLLNNRLGAVLATFGAVALTPRWTLGGNDLASSMLTPEPLAWPLAIWGVALALERPRGGRLLVGAVLLGLATCFHALVGLHAAGLLGLWLLVRAAREGEVGGLLVFAAAYTVSALPMLGPILLQQTQAAEPDLGGLSTYALHVEGRLPHHHLFSAFSRRSIASFGLLVLLGVPALAWLGRRGRLRRGAFLTSALTAIGVLCLTAFVFTEVRPTYFVAKLQLFKLTVWAKLLLIVGIAGAAAALLPERLRAVTLRPRLLFALTLAAWAVVLALVLAGPLAGRAPALTHPQTPTGQVERWAQTQTAAEARFAVPPSAETFQSWGERSALVTFKSFPFQPEEMEGWVERLQVVAPSRWPPEAQGFAWRAELDEAFLAQPPAAWRAVAARYDVQYLLRPPAPAFDAAFETTYRSPEWAVYRVGTEDAGR